jgi:hypothetical protein
MARALANQMAVKKARLEAASARYEEWFAKTAGIRETAAKAKADQQRRGHEPAPAETPQPQSTLEWWQELQANIEAADRALARQQQATIDAGHELQARADDATARAQAQRAELDASSKHTARMERNTKAEPQANWQAEAPDEIEMEL